MTIYISNLNSITSQNDLTGLFVSFGAVHFSNIRTVIDYTKSRMISYAYIDIPERSKGEAAIRKLNKFVFLDNIINVEEAR